MEETVSKKMKIELNVESASLIKVVDENEKDAVLVEPLELEEIHNSPNGFRYVGTILQAKRSPTCMYIVIGGRTYKICI